MSTMTSTRTPEPRPFLKWAGGKGQLLPDLMRRVESVGEFGRYHEPFVGGGALFFELFRRRKLGRKRAYLSDNNSRLIETYQGVRDDVERVIRRLAEHQKVHSDAHYYKTREHVPKSAAERAARIVYLNKTCFNGLYRENSRGEFNVPMGRYDNPRICDAENLRAVSRALAKAKIENRHFETVVDKAEAGDLVYFDPPYHPLSKTASFTAYDRGSFTEADQEALADVCDELDKKAVKFLLSNSMTPFIQKLYRKYRVESVQAARAVNSRGDRRGKVPEALVRNY